MDSPRASKRQPRRGHCHAPYEQRYRCFSCSAGDPCPNSCAAPYRDLTVNVDQGRYLAAHLPGARYVEMAGHDHLVFVGDGDRLVDEIQEFLTGSRSEQDVDRVLATVMFTDIVDSNKTRRRTRRPAVARAARSPRRDGAAAAEAVSRERGQEPRR